MKRLLPLFIFTLSILNSNTYAMPIDWRGNLSFDSQIISNARYLKKTENSTSIDDGSQEITLGSLSDNEASFQSYIFTLSPLIIVNDSTVIKGQLSTGYARGGRLGDDTTHTKTGLKTAGLYHHQTASGSKALSIQQLYAEIYGSTATYHIGRHPIHWGLGAIYHSGENDWDRFSSLRDGVTMKIKLGNFRFEPFISKRWSSDSLSAQTKGNEMGATVTYNNVESDLTLGLLYSKLSLSEKDTQVTTAQNNNSLGESDLKLTDFVIQKNWKNIKVNIEIPIFSGTIGDVYTAGSSIDFTGQAFLLNGLYEVNDQLNLNVMAGHVSGEDDDTSEFSALYLNPNFQIANIMFRYNRQALSNQNENVFDSSINNTNFLKVGVTYKDKRSTWNLGVVHAVANEVATSSSTSAYNHTTGKQFTPSQDQETSLGTEFDVNFKYKWNEETGINLDFGYLIPGDYYAFTNAATTNEVENSLFLNIGVNIKF